MAKRTIASSFNVRIYEHTDGSMSLGYVHRFKANSGGGGTWLNGNKRKLARRLGEVSKIRVEPKT